MHHEILGSGFGGLLSGGQAWPHSFVSLMIRWVRRSAEARPPTVHEGARPRHMNGSAGIEDSTLVQLLFLLVQLPR